MVNTRAQTSRMDGVDASVTDTGNANANADAGNVGNASSLPRSSRLVIGQTPRARGRDGDEERVIEQVPTQLEMLTQLRELQAVLRRTEEELRIAREEREFSSYRSGWTGGSRSSSRGQSRHRSEASSTPSRAHVAPTRSVTPVRPEHAARVVMDQTAARPSKYYKVFLGCKPVEFIGGYDPVTNIRWLKEMEGIFQASECPENMKVIFATRMLKDGALDWWETTRDALGSVVVDEMTWDMFKVRFLEEYCTVRDKQILEKEFLTLKKGDGSIHDYARIFMEKLKFVGHIFSTEESRISRYMEGLPPSYRGYCRRYATLAEVIQESKLVDDDQRCEKELEKKERIKRKSDEVQESSKKLKGTTQESGGSGDREVIWCDRCKSKHSGECSASTQKCLNCRKLGHMSRDCKEGIRCFNCQQKGHISVACPNKRVEQEKIDA